MCQCLKIIRPKLIRKWGSEAFQWFAGSRDPRVAICAQEIYRAILDPVSAETMDAAALRLLEVLRRGEPLGEEVSVLKLAVTELFQRVTDLLLEAAGEHGATDVVLQLGDGSTLKPVNPYYLSRPATIYGGSSEVQRNILAKALLRLPG